MSRSLLLLTTIALVLSTFASSTMSAYGQDDSDVWEGSFIIGDASTGSEGDECEVRLGWFQVGNEVQLVDDDDEIEARSTLETGELTSQMGCEFSFAFDDVDLDGAYSITVASSEEGRRVGTFEVDGPGPIHPSAYMNETVTVVGQEADSPTPLEEALPADADDSHSDRIDELEARVSELEAIVEALTAEEPDVPTTDTAGTSYTITGALIMLGLDSDDFRNSRNLGCQLESRGYNDIYSGAQIRVTDSGGTLLATGRLGTPSEEDFSETRCQFSILIEDVPASDFYTFEMGRRGGISYTLAEMEANDWHVELSLGS